MADEETQEKIFKLLDLLSTQVGAIVSDVAEHRKETGAGFARVERRLGNLETRVEGVETELKDLKTEVRGADQNLERRVSALEAQ